MSIEERLCSTPLSTPEYHLWYQQYKHLIIILGRFFHRKRTQLIRLPCEEDFQMRIEILEQEKSWVREAFALKPSNENFSISMSRRVAQRIIPQIAGKKFID